MTTLVGTAPLLDLARQPPDLAPVEEHLSLAERVVVEDVRRFVGADVAFDEEDLPVLYFGKALLQADPSFADGLDLAAPEGQARLQGFQYLEVMGDVFIDGHGLHGQGASFPEAGSRRSRLM
jgi:hypothetical protein